MEKREFPRYSSLEKKIITSIVIAAGLSFTFLILSTGQQDFANSTFTIFPLSDKPIMERILLAEGLTFSGFFFALVNTYGIFLLALSLGAGSPIAILGIFPVYSMVCIPIILTRREIKLKRRIIYAYFSSTQFSLLPIAILVFAGL